MIYGFQVCFPGLPIFVRLGFLSELLGGSARLWWGHRLGFVGILRKDGLFDPLEFVWAFSGALSSPFEIGNFPILGLRFLCWVVFWGLAFNCLMNLEYGFRVCFWDFSVYCVSGISICVMWNPSKRHWFQRSVFNSLQKSQKSQVVYLFAENAIPLFCLSPLQKVMLPAHAESLEA